MRQITTEKCKDEEPSEFENRFVSIQCKKGDVILRNRTGAALKKNFVLTAFDGSTEDIRCQIVKDDKAEPTGKCIRDVGEIFTFEDDFETENWRVPQMQILKPGKGSCSLLHPMKLRRKYFLPKKQKCEVHTYDDEGELIEIDVIVLSQEDCDDEYPGLNPINICMEMPEGCTCNKPQPGAGLECDDLLVGVINDDPDCVDNKKPRLAADVNEVRRWIGEILAEHGHGSADIMRTINFWVIKTKYAVSPGLSSMGKIRCPARYDDVFAENAPQQYCYYLYN
uniref:Peptidase S1 domain-containing protein n=1 Tax=Glossina austeni TaxID=7395 RepID=A0A1A9VEM2_GLOAU